MKICFLWVRSFRSFKNLNLNISSSSKYRFNEVNFKLHRENLEPLPADFFNDAIVDVAAIVGINGVGKSNALELLCAVLKGPRSFIKSDFLLIYETGKKTYCRYSFSNGEHPTAEFEVELEPFSEKINPLKVIYFSNVYDEREHKFDADITDISLNSEYRNLRTLRSPKTGKFEKQIKFIADSALFETLEVQAPVQLKVSVRNRYLSTPSMHFAAKAAKSEEFELFAKYFRRRIAVAGPSDRLIALLSVNLFFAVYLGYLNQYKEVGRHSKNNAFYDINNILLTAVRTDDMSSFVNYLLNNLELISRHSHFPIVRDIRFDNSKEEISEAWIMKRIEFLRSMPSWLGDDTDLISAERNPRSEFALSFNLGDKTKISNFSSLFSDDLGVDVDWLGISSGQKAYINIFASIVFELKKYHKNSSNILICIDEGDLYLHPQWQINFFDKLTSIISKLSPRENFVQLVLTSHSPFILSDLPKQNITILGQDSNSYQKDGYRLENQTFAGNLYDLFCGPLFLQVPAISSFARKKIDSVLFEIRSLEVMSAKQEKAYRSFSALIGDDVTRSFVNEEIQEVETRREPKQ